MVKIAINESNVQKQQNAYVKDWLWRYRKAKLEVRRLEGEYEELVSIQESAGAVNYDGMPHGSESPDLSSLIIMRDSSLSKIIKARRKMADTLAEIIRAIDMLEDVERDIISLRYVQLVDGFGIRSMEEIADSIKYTSRYVQKIHGVALQKLYSIIPQITKEVY